MPISYWFLLSKPVFLSRFAGSVGDPQKKHQLVLGFSNYHTVLRAQHLLISVRYRQEKALVKSSIVDQSCLRNKSSGRILQALWEDPTSKQQRVRVNWCYAPSDIPAQVGKPEPSGVREVYESNHSDENPVGSILGPCVLLPQKVSRYAVHLGPLERPPRILL